MRPLTFNEFVLQSPRRIALPLAVYPGLALTGAKVSDVVTNPRAQFDAQTALQERYSSPVVLSAMDLSAEAEAFGCRVMMSDAEVPTVIGRLVTNLEQAEKLTLPQPGDRRTAIYLETVRLLRQRGSAPYVFGGFIGPFSLAARLVGVSEAMELSVTEPGLMHVLLEKSAAFLANYLKAFRAAGAHGVIMAEPAAGLLSPRGMAALSSAYIRWIAAGAGEGRFTIMLHNCAAKLLHLPAILETGLRTFHFGGPMDIAGALAKVSSDTVLCGNLDPAAVFVQSSVDALRGRTEQLIEKTAAHRNFVISSGCDLPPNTPLASLDAFHQAVNSSGAFSRP